MSLRIRPFINGGVNLFDDLPFSDPIGSVRNVAERNKDYICVGLNLYTADQWLEYRGGDIVAPSGGGGSSISSTNDLSEGSAHLYYTNARADARITLALGQPLSLSAVVIGETPGMSIDQNGKVVAPSYNGLTVTTTTGTLTIANGVTLNAGTGGTLGTAAFFPEAHFTTPAQVAASISALVASSPSALDTLNELAIALGNDANFSTTITNLLALKAPLASPSFTTPSLGVATATKINKVTITAPATGSTLTVSDGKTLTVDNTVRLAGTDGISLTFGGSFTIAGAFATAFTVTGATTLILPTSGTLATAADIATAISTLAPLAGPAFTGFIKIANSAKPATPVSAGEIYFDTTNRLSWIGTNGFVRTFDGTANTADRIYVLPDAAGTVVINSATQTLTNKIISTGCVVPCELIIACGDETTSASAGVGKVTFRMPYAMTVTAVRLSAVTAPTGGTLLTVDINEAGVSILSTKLTLDASEKTSLTAATAAVISDASLADDAEISIDFDAVGSTIAGAGIKVTIIGTRTLP